MLVHSFRAVLCAGALTGALVAPAVALQDPQTPLVDPYDSGMWNYQQMRFLDDPAEIQFDDRVKVLAPDAAEDAFHTPVHIDASAIPDVVKMVVTVDYGPIPHILTYYPDQAQAKVSFRFKIDQTTPVRASVQTRDGAWFVGGTEISAAGGGCTAPAAAYANADWEERMGEVHGRVWPASGRVRAIIDHPMDTGLADGIPVFIIETVSLETLDGAALARVEMFEPVDEDPALTFFLSPDQLIEPLRLKARDNNGGVFAATLTAAEAVR